MQEIVGNSPFQLTHQTGCTKLLSPRTFCFITCVFLGAIKQMYGGIEGKIVKAYLLFPHLLIITKNSLPRRFSYVVISLVVIELVNRLSALFFVIILGNFLEQKLKKKTVIKKFYRRKKVIKMFFKISIINQNTSYFSLSTLGIVDDVWANLAHCGYIETKNCSKMH